MKNYRRPSRDGSVKVVLSGDSNSPPKTTPRREPPPYDSTPAQELRTPPAILFAFPRVPSRFRENVDFATEDLRKFQKKPVFAHIRGLCDSYLPREFSTIAFLFSATTDNGQLPPLEQNVDLEPSSFPLPSVQNPTRLTSSHQNAQKCLGIPHIPVNPTCPSQQKVDSVRSPERSNFQTLSPPHARDSTGAERFLCSKSGIGCGWAYKLMIDDQFRMNQSVTSSAWSGPSSKRRPGYSLNSHSGSSSDPP
jgi:hypothetical protein